MVTEIQQRFGHTETKACGLVGISRSLYRYTPGSTDDTVLKERMKVLAQQKPRYGVRRLHIILKKESLVVNHKWTERIYREEGLAIRTKPRKKIPSNIRQALTVPQQINKRWAIDFVHDSTATGTRFRAFSVLDVFSRECLDIRVDTSIPARAAIDTLERIIETRGTPEVITADNGPEFISKKFSAWAYEKGIRICFIRPGKPMENAFVESFQGKFRDECLNLHWFRTKQDAREIIEKWRIEYNTERPHSSLKDLTPEEFVKRMALTV